MNDGTTLDSTSAATDIFDHDANVDFLVDLRLRCADVPSPAVLRARFLGATF